MLLAIDFDDDFIDEEGVTIAPVLSLQSAGINGSELDAPETDCLSADGDATFSQEIFNISMTEIEAIVEPSGVGNDIGWESVTFISILSPILPFLGS